jgi:hypothetical protein
MMHSLVKVGDKPGMSFPGCPALGARLAEMQAFGDAFGDTGRFQTLIDSVHAKITLDGFAGRRVPLGRAPRAGRDTRFAAHAKLTIDENNAVLGSFLHRTRGTGRDTPGILAMEAGHKDISHAGQVVDLSGAHGNDLGQPRPDRQIVLCFTMGFAAETSDAALGILVDVVLAHAISSGDENVIGYRLFVIRICYSLPGYFEH